MKIVNLFVLLIMASFSANTLAAPNQGPDHIYDIWWGEAWYDSGQGSVVTAGSQAACNVKLQDAIDRHVNDGDVVVSITWCKLSKWKSDQALMVAPGDLEDIEDRYNIDEYNSRMNDLDEEYDISGFREELYHLHMNGIEVEN